MNLELGRQSFERLVAEALDELPEEFASRMENIAVVVEAEPEPETLEELGLDPEEDELLGLYQGTPLIERGHDDVILPDRVLIYMMPILRVCETERQVVREVKKTVIHEIGHHFGLSDEEMPY